jgi:hypothetical protein
MVLCKWKRIERRGRGDMGKAECWIGGFVMLQRIIQLLYSTICTPPAYRSTPKCSQPYYNANSNTPQHPMVNWPCFQIIHLSPTLPINSQVGTGQTSIYLGLKPIKTVSFYIINNYVQLIKSQKKVSITEIRFM